MSMSYNRELIYRAKELRKNMTKEERHLWFDFLKQCPVKFTAQKVIDEYIVDFYSADLGLVIELDGDHHKRDVQTESADKLRDKRLNELGYKVLRFSNYEIHQNFRGVCDTITEEIFSTPLSRG